MHGGGVRGGGSTSHTYFALHNYLPTKNQSLVLIMLLEMHSYKHILGYVFFSEYLIWL